MSFKSTLFAAAAALSFALPAFAGDIMVQDPYVRTSTMMSKSGAAFMTLMNHGSEDDRLVSASSDVAQRVELHTHKEDANGVMQMLEVKEGFPVPAGGMHALARGGDHVMFMGLNRQLAQGDIVTLTLTFEKAGDMTVEVPVDLDRKPMNGMKMNMQHQQGGMKKDN
ncbi:copper chaperone PCu(A)C [Antarcticimicrobium sediminis]|uniref:Copper chaperone PCu(A)C n=1 Tax=Antarcticimicrobium sediminis TaxID=2546227 RepID=A0A4R5EX17_9RHOB|nr:copper chaperone PCu(A)C [Antarcticimicrobium sediminis]TDE39545.1 copper chaperone PCu(A)C [Antarcticimicrobium sediminis]